MWLLHTLGERAARWNDKAQSDRDARGGSPRENVVERQTAHYENSCEKAREESVSELKSRVRPIFQLAVQKGAFLNVDMEQYKFKNMTLQVFKELLQEPEFKSYPHFGVVIQAYLRDALIDVKDLIQFSQTRGTR